MKTTVFLVSVVLAAIVSPAMAEIYKWVDEQGRVHYSDKAVEDSEPMNVPSEKKQSSSASSVDRKQRRQRLLQAFEEDRATRKQQADEVRQKKAKLSRQCVVAKDQLRGMQRSNRLYDLDKSGNRVYLSDEQRRKATARLSAEIKKHCK
jgi:hypothetical protein